MPTLHLKYGSRPDGEGYGIMEESDAINASDRDTLVKFCKAIRWRPEKRNLPAAFSVAIVPAPNILWLCRIDETKDDQGRHLAYLLQADGYFRSDDASIKQIQEALAQQNVPFDTSQDFDKLESPVILLHADLLYFSNSGTQRTQDVQPDDRQSQKVTQHPQKPFSYTASSTLKRSDHRGQPMKTASAFIIGVIICAISLWFGIIKPTRQESSRNINERKLAEGAITQWAESAKKHFPEVRTPDQLSSTITSHLNELNQMRQRMDVEELASTLTDEQIDSLNAMLKSKRLARDLQQVRQAIDELQQSLPTTENIESAVNPALLPTNRSDQTSIFQASPP